MPANDPNSAPEDRFVISRIFDAPRELVWKAWTEPERIGAWLGPKGAPLARVIRFELRSGGVFLSAMKMPDGSEGARSSSIAKSLRFRGSSGTFFRRRDGNLARHPMSPNWPLELLTTVTFADLGERTEVTLDWVPLNANEVELKTFSDGKPGMQGGWTGSFDQLAEYLART